MTDCNFVNHQGKTKLVCLIPELCYMTGLTDEMRNDFHVMKDIAQHTRVTPTVRLASLRTFIKNVNGWLTPCNTLKMFAQSQSLEESHYYTRTLGN